MKAQYALTTLLATFWAGTNAKLGESGHARHNEADRSRELLEIDVVGSDPTQKLGRCQGDCDSDANCEEGLICFQRHGFEPVPGCEGGSTSRSDFCVDPADINGNSGAPPPPTPNPPTDAPPTPNPPTDPPPFEAIEQNPGPDPPRYGGPRLKDWSNNPNAPYPFGECEGDCDTDNDCQSGLICLQREARDPVPGCSGTSSSKTDFCIKDPNGPDPNGPEFIGPDPTTSAPTTPVSTPVSTPSPTPLPTPKPTNKPTKEPPSVREEEEFKLKMYWEKGYYWQEESVERKWCMTCHPQTGCQRGKHMYINWCGSGQGNVRFDFVPVEGKYAMIQLHGSNTCFERDDDDGRKMKMQRCDDDNPMQHWFAGRGSFNGGRFEINPRTAEFLCLTQLHHPKPGEEMLLQNCKVARGDDTTWWERY